VKRVAVERAYRPGIPVSRDAVKSDQTSRSIACRVVWCVVTQISSVISEDDVVQEMCPKNDTRHFLDCFHGTR
jgi:hypothetical protein